MNNKALYTLEFDKILEQLAELAQTEGAAELARRLMSNILYVCCRIGCVLLFSAVDINVAQKAIFLLALMSRHAR